MEFKIYVKYDRYVGIYGEVAEKRITMETLCYLHNYRQRQLVSIVFSTAKCPEIHSDQSVGRSCTEDRINVQVP